MNLYVVEYKSGGGCAGYKDAKCLKKLLCLTLFLSAKPVKIRIDHFCCLVAWPLNESEAGSDLVLIETSLLFSC